MAYETWRFEMGKRDDEVERLIRLRDQQLRARDPKKKDRKLQHNIARRYRSSREPFSLTKLWTDVEKKWRGMILGAFLGFVILIVLPYFVKTKWVELIGIAVVLFITLVGFAIGQAADARDELQDLIHKR
jgi:hypothetical protein